MKRSLRRRFRNAAILAAKSVDSACRVDEALLASEEGVALIADIDGKVRPRRTSLELISASADNRDRTVLGVDAFLHDASGFEPRVARQGRHPSSWA